MVIDQAVTDEYSLYHADNVEVMKDMPQNATHLTVTSIPFSSLYSYTDSVRDAGNVRSDKEFWDGMWFMLNELYRITMPGRLVVTHCMDMPSTLERDGYIGIRDFSGDVIRQYQRHGFIYHSKVTIWKDPLIAATRTHALGLAHKQLVQDSSMSRQGIPDYLIVMRKPGKNPEPISHLPSGLSQWIGPPELEPKVEKRSDPSVNKYSHEVWQRLASPVWADINPSDTLQFRSVREDDDTRHLCPLQLTVIRRALELWSAQGDTVFDPFAGICSTGYVALQGDRRFVGCELKSSYWRQGVRNLDSVLESRTQARLEMV